MTFRGLSASRGRFARKATRRQEEEEEEVSIQEAETQTSSDGGEWELIKKELNNFISMCVMEEPEVREGSYEMFVRSSCREHMLTFVFVSRQNKEIFCRKSGSKCGESANNVRLVEDKN
ncbi:hypothetical protein F2P81_012155 [Scophthalmus maximus]|uniref:Uncharacterized protein n=1 Tax=Scophthalmus maximus TaxID=52904 RepID=A0A6A4SMK2_SCOMX|nr:hypothetical protein F2P81_012155 [Scophthalmus maximus]